MDNSDAQRQRPCETAATSAMMKPRWLGAKMTLQLGRSSVLRRSVVFFMRTLEQSSSLGIQGLDAKIESHTFSRVSFRLSHAN